MRRRYPALLLVLASVIALALVSRETPAARTATFGVAATGWMPHVPPMTGITETWFCPGVPATGQGDVEGAVLIANRTDQPLLGTVLVIDDTGENQRLNLSIEPWDSATVDLDATLPSEMVGAIVEIERGGAIVEQQSFQPSGNSSSACSNTTSDVWYLADGFTVEGSLDQIVLFNPYEQTVSANLEFVTREGERAPVSYRGLNVPPLSIRVIDLGAPGAGAQSEPILAVKVETSQGRLVVGRSQTYLGGGRLGTQVTLASPELREQWWFANGQKGPGTTEQYTIYNPTKDDVEVDVVILGIPPGADGSLVVVDPIPVAAGSVAIFDPSTVAELPETEYEAVFATLESPAVIVERVTTQNIDGIVATSVIVGGTAPPDGIVPVEWRVPAAPSVATTGALAVYNVNNDVGVVSVFVVGSSGPVPVEGLQNIVLPPPNDTLRIDLTDPVVFGRQLIVQSSNQIFVEQWFPTGRADTRYATWALPAR